MTEEQGGEQEVVNNEVGGYSFGRKWSGHGASVSNRPGDWAPTVFVRFVEIPDRGRILV